MADHMPMAIPDEVLLWGGALRYWLGRKTIAVGSFCNLLIEHWPQLSQRTRDLLRRDVEEAFERDDKARAESLQWHPLGMDCDRAEWLRVRALWGS